MKPFSAGLRAMLAGCGIALVAVPSAVESARPVADAAEGYCERAQALFRAGALTAAVVEYNRAAAISPANPRPYIGLAVLYEGVNRPDLAVEALEHLQLANPDAEHLACRLAEAHLGAEDLYRARDLGAWAAWREPACARAFSVYGIALARGRYWESAAASLTRARQLAPEDAGLGEALLECYIQQGAFVRASEFGGELLQAGPESARLHYLTGLAFSQRLQGPATTDAAVAHLTRAAELDSTRFAPHAELGRLYRSLGRRREALQAFERAQAIDPTAPGVAFNLAALRGTSGSIGPKPSAPQRDRSSISVLRARFFQQPQDLDNTLALVAAESGERMHGVALHRLRGLLRQDPGEVRLLGAYIRLDREARAGYPDYLRPGPG